MPAETQQLTQLHAQSAEVAKAIDLAQDFVPLVRQRQPTHLDRWLTRATTSPIEALRRFATGLYEDYEAVTAGVTLPWSTSPVEGHLNRLTMVKRQMCGRARLDLLSHRFLLAPRDRRACPRPTGAVGRPRPGSGGVVTVPDRRGGCGLSRSRGSGGCIAAAVAVRHVPHRRERWRRAPVGGAHGIAVRVSSV